MALPYAVEAAELYPPRTWAEVDLSAIRHNVRTLRRYITPSQFMAVVKANGYGLGAIPIAKAALEAGATALAVATCEEGQELRRAGITAPILILGYAPVEWASLAAECDLTVTVHSVEFAQALSRAALRYRRNKPPLPVHLKLDTGLHRFGLYAPDLLPIARQIASLPGLHLQGLYSHFATGDGDDLSYVYEQIKRFEQGKALLAAEGFKFPQLHLSNSAAGMRVKAAHANFVRFGLALYGYYPSEITRLDARQAGINLRPALTLKSVVATVNDVPAGESVGYGQTYRVEGPSAQRLALIPIGYADGFPRLLSNRGAVLIGGQRVPIVGRVSMDQIMADVTALPNVQEGDEVVILGSQGKASITPDEVAELSGTISYEVLTGLGRRIKRVYAD